MKKNLRLILPGLALVALTATGCWITSAQIFAHFDLPNPFTINGADGFERVYVDLNTISDYADNKDKLKGISDLAVVGKFTNTSGPGGGVEVYITPGNTNLANPTAIVAGSTKLWGPGSIGATGDVHTVGWDESAALFDAAGKAILLAEAQGDGEFTIYTIGSPGTVNVIRVDDGGLILVLAAGL
ncbi:MAG: hypothetical protein HZC42_14190 [Candidatus Eisenbacteria bacterium]|nr:hypothetical protein [Candidatus Eisenbacteria bacterium]